MTEATIRGTSLKWRVTGKMCGSCFEAPICRWGTPQMPFTNPATKSSGEIGANPPPAGVHRLQPLLARKLWG